MYELTWYHINLYHMDAKMVVKKRIVTARRTVYSLIGAGLHGLNGVNSYIAIHMIPIYVIPR
jgi:hypothetical protein